MIIKETISELKKERENNLPSRFQCRAIMVKTIKQYCLLLCELKKICDKVITADEIFLSKDVMPGYLNLSAPSYQDKWVILTGVSEYLRLFSKKEATDKRFTGLWFKQAPANSPGRIIIPLWGCEPQWFDHAINLNSDPRQTDFYYDCTDDEQQNQNQDQDQDQEQEMNLLVLADVFEKHISEFKKDNNRLFVGLKQFFEYWQNPNESNTQFVLATKHFNSVASTLGTINVRVCSDFLSFIQKEMSGSEYLTHDNCTEEMQLELFKYALQGECLDDSLLKILNVASFSGIDIMTKWNNLSIGHKKFVKLWFQIHPDNSYLSYCFSMSNSVNDVHNFISFEILKRRLDKPEWVEEFKQLAQVMKLNHDEKYFEKVDAIPEFEKRLDFVTSAESSERIYIIKMVGKWLQKDTEQVYKSEKLKKLFPALYAYLSNNVDVLQNDIGAYLRRYKAYKLKNTLPEDEEEYFNGVDTFSFEYRYAILSEYKDEDTFILWVDALGVEWLSLLYYTIKNKCEDITIKAAIAQATLPTETCFNEQWKAMTQRYKKLDTLDKLAHNGVIDKPDYYACIEKQIEFVEGLGNIVSSLLKENKRVVVTADHGASRLAARFFHRREGFNVMQNAVVCSRGRYCRLAQGSEAPLANIKIVKGTQGEDYAVFSNYDHFKQPGFAAGADDQNATYGEIHGGATPEEMLVPVIVAESSKASKITACWKEQTVKIFMKKAKLLLTFNKPIKNLAVKMNDIQALVEKTDTEKTWNIVFKGAKEGTFSVEINADGRFVDVPDITLLSPLAGGIGDL